ncbi:RND transporter, partial [Pseudomonas sp. PA-3-6H]|nr:RND transporter [Pseudomonas sp. PA-3-6H]
MCLLLTACGTNPPAIDNGLAAPAAWPFAEREATQAINQRWWTQFGSPALNRLIAQARRDRFDVAAGTARV